MFWPVIIFLGVLIVVCGVSSAIHAAMNEMPTETHVKPSALRWLPSAFYVIAILGFAGFVILAIQSENSFLFGYGIGATIACFGSGRLIELVQDINDELYRKRMSESP